MSNATHVAFDLATVERLSRMGATSVVRVSDRLVIGPSRRDPLEHTRAREAFFGSPIGASDHLYSAAVRWEPPIVLWVSTSIDQRVSLWRVLHRLRDLGIAIHDVFPLEFERFTPSTPPKRPLAPFECGASVVHHPDELLWSRLAGARPWRRARYDRAPSLWERYVDPDPKPFVRSCIRGVSGFPELGPLWMFLSAFFPRRTAQGGIRLSRFDELLLRILSSEWQTPVKVFIHDSPMGEELLPLGSCAGDLFLERRLAHWARHGESPAVERTEGPKPGSPMLSSVYRITERGLRLRERGLAHLSDAPALPLAGIEAYAPDNPWVLLEDGRLARP